MFNTFRASFAPGAESAVPANVGNASATQIAAIAVRIILISIFAIFLLPRQPISSATSAFGIMVTSTFVFDGQIIA
jgi:hypothetical protein